MREFALYTVLRLALLLASAGILYLLGVRGLWLIALAAVLSGIVSYYLLSPLRDAMAIRLTERSARTRRGLDAAAGSEDGPVDEPRSAQREPGAQQ